MTSLHCHNRRDFVRLLSAGSVIAAANRLVPNFLSHAAAPAPAAAPLISGLNFPEAPFSREDTLTLPEGFEYEILLRHGEVLGKADRRYGDDNDYLAFLTDADGTGWLWVNHESTLAVHEKNLKAEDEAKTAEVLKDVGGSCLRLRRDAASGRWRPVLTAAENFRIDGLDTRIPMTGPAAGHALVGGAKEVIGSVANCSGGITPWRTFCSGEENFHEFFGDPEFKEEPILRCPKYHRPPEHYGWIVEIDPRTGGVFKHTALGRFAHENIAFTLTKDGRLAAYMGDDRSNQCVYKFLSREKYDAATGTANRRLLEDGLLHAADTVNGRWLPLHPDHNRALQASGFDPARICVHTRAAAKIAGATPLGRPEDVEIHPATGEVFVCLTTHGLPEGAKHGICGAVLSIREKDDDAGALEFESSVMLPTGTESGLVWQDNLSFASAGALMITTDYKVSDPPAAGSGQEKFGNNMLFVALTDGPERGKVRRFAVAPRGAEFCSPTLSPDGSELWVCIQHPGEGHASTWPNGPGGKPQSALVAIRRRLA
jgi:uncharacterized protein